MLSIAKLTIVLSTAEVKVRANVATELRDSIEPLCSGANYPVFLAKLWPVFKAILKGDPVFLSLSYEQVCIVTDFVDCSCAVDSSADRCN